MSALDDAIDDLEELAREGIGYTDEYFVKKWGMKERLEEYPKIIRTELAQLRAVGDAAREARLILKHYAEKSDSRSARMWLDNWGAILDEAK